MELPEGAVAPLAEQDDFEIDALDAIDRRRWLKRKLTGEEAAQKRAMMVQPAGQSTASAGIILPRNFEVLDTPLGSGQGAPTSEVPDDVKLVVVATEASTRGAADSRATCMVEWLEEEGDGVLPEAEAATLPAGRRSFYALLDGVDGPCCAAFAAQRLPALLAKRYVGVGGTVSRRSAWECT